jgi:hypothetical protein
MHRPFESQPRRVARPLSRVLTLLALALLSACGSDGGGEPLQSLTWSAQLVSPNGAEGAAVLEIDGDVAAVRGPAGSRILTHDANGRTRVIVVLDQPGTIAFELDLAERAPKPGANVVEVSGPDDALRATTAGYSVSVRARE